MSVVGVPRPQFPTGPHSTAGTTLALHNNTSWLSVPCLALKARATFPHFLADFERGESHSTHQVITGELIPIYSQNQHTHTQQPKQKKEKTTSDKAAQVLWFASLP